MRNDGRRRNPFRLAMLLGVLALAGLVAGTALGVRAAQPLSAIEMMQAPGKEAQELARRAGDWDVTMTLRPAPDAPSVVTDGLLASRRMIGLFLEETLAPEPQGAQPDFRRISYMTYSRVEGRWQYVSLDTRFPAGIMPAWSSEPERDGRIVLQFEPLAFAGWGETVDGWMMRSNYELTRLGPDHEVARQYWVRADGTGRRWLAVEYDYRRRP